MIRGGIFRAGLLAVTVGLIGSCGNSAKPDPAYRVALSAGERRDIERELAGKGELAAACGGDGAAIHAILVATVRGNEQGGERAEGCTTRNLTLLFHLGDKAFAESIRREPEPVRKAVGVSIDGTLEGYHLNQFPETRKSYRYREGRRTPH